jgi:hypothetical protein
MDLRQATVAEKNAAFNAVHADIVALITQWVPSFMQYKAQEKLESPEGRTGLIKLVSDALAAAEKVREATPPTPSAKP